MLKMKSSRWNFLHLKKCLGLTCLILGLSQPDQIFDENKPILELGKLLFGWVWGHAPLIPVYSRQIRLEASRMLRILDLISLACLAGCER